MDPSAQGSKATCFDRYYRYIMHDKLFCQGENPTDRFSEGRLLIHFRKFSLRNVNVSVPQGKMIAVVGPHGSGKKRLGLPSCSMLE